VNNDNIAFQSQMIAVYLAQNISKKSSSEIFPFLDSLPKDMSNFPLMFTGKDFGPLSGTTFED
jgi:hypothetical protein